MAVYGIDSAIISRYNITEILDHGVKIEFNPGNEVAVFAVHLVPYPYGPYNLRDDPALTEGQLIETADKSRGEDTEKLLAQAQPFIDQGTPVFFVGDFNEPSHLDWTEATVTAGIREKKVAWPTSKRMEEAGYIDAYRYVYPDPVINPANTWTPLPSKNEVHDRIDYVYFSGASLTVTESELVGPNDGLSSIIYEPYPSDHRAVVADMLLEVSP